MKIHTHPSGKQRFALECCTVLNAPVPMFLFKFAQYESSPLSALTAKMRSSLLTM
jgi:hypothetical protein